MSAEGTLSGNPIAAALAAELAEFELDFDTVRVAAFMATGDGDFRVAGAVPEPLLRQWRAWEELIVDPAAARGTPAPRRS